VKTSRPGWSRYWYCSPAGLTGLLAWATLNQFHHQLRQRFQLLANERYSRIEERFRIRSSASMACAFFRQFRFGFAQRIRRLCQPLLLRTQAYSYAPRVSRAERPAIEQAVRSEGFSTFTFRELNADGQLQTAGSSRIRSGDLHPEPEPLATAGL
jgi:hypothetical protein